MTGRANGHDRNSALGDHTGRHVTLPADQSPIFGPGCLACRRTDAIESIPWRAYKPSALPGLLRLLSRSRRVFDVPLCASCRRRLTPRMLLRELPPLIIGVAAIVAAVEFIDWKMYEPPVPGMIGLGLVGGFVAFVMVWRLFFRNPIDIAEVDKLILYSFRSTTQAAEFARRNGVPASDASGRSK